MRALQPDFTTTTTRVSPHATFRLFLQAELARRCSSNPQYSLRSFALKLKIDHSTLSQMLRGKRLLSYQMIGKLGVRLALDRSTIDAFIQQKQSCRGCTMQWAPITIVSAKLTRRAF